MRVRLQGALCKFCIEIAGSAFKSDFRKQAAFRKLLIERDFRNRPKWEQRLQYLPHGRSKNQLNNNQMQRSMTMKLGKTLFIICMIVVASTSVWAQNGKGMHNGNQNGGTNCLLTQATTAAPLTADQAAILQSMREEEKLARDVYQFFASTYSNVRIFSNIAASEQRHFDALGTLLVRYGIEDLAQADAGSFTNPDFRALYSKLTVEGSSSLLAALQVGVDIEVMDMEDLAEAMAATKDHKDVFRVYGNLLNGSENHLDAFNSLLDVISN
jgi:hypothetical protein